MAPESTLRRVLSTFCCNMTAEFAIDNVQAVGPPNTGQGREPAIRLRTLSTSLAAWLDSTPYCLQIWGAEVGAAAVEMGWCVAAVEGGWLGG